MGGPISATIAGIYILKMENGKVVVLQKELNSSIRNTLIYLLN